MADAVFNRIYDLMSDKVHKEGFKMPKGKGKENLDKNSLTYSHELNFEGKDYSVEMVWNGNKNYGPSDFQGFGKIVEIKK